MSFQPEVSTYETGIYQWEVTDPVQGGIGGVDNVPILQLANRTKYLKTHVDAIEVATTAFTGITPAGTYSVPATVFSNSNVFQMRLNNKTNEVEFRGSVLYAGGGGFPGAILYTLPLGKRPSSIKLFVVPISIGGSALLTIDPVTGVMYCQAGGGGEIISLDSVRFSLD